MEYFFHLKFINDNNLIRRMKDYTHNKFFVSYSAMQITEFMRISSYYNNKTEQYEDIIRFIDFCMKTDINATYSYLYKLLAYIDNELFEVANSKDKFAIYPLKFNLPHIIEYHEEQIKQIEDISKNKDTRSRKIAIVLRLKEILEKSQQINIK